MLYKAWNELDDEIKTAETLSKFKNCINPNRKRNNTLVVYSNFGQRCTQIVLAKIRLGCSDLNAHKLTRHLVNDSTCSCGHAIEDPAHYFLLCLNYQNIRSNKYFYLKKYRH